MPFTSNLRKRIGNQRFSRVISHCPGPASWTSRTFWAQREIGFEEISSLFQRNFGYMPPGMTRRPKGWWHRQVIKPVTKEKDPFRSF